MLALVAFVSIAASCSDDVTADTDATTVVATTTASTVSLTSTSTSTSIALDRPATTVTTTPVTTASTNTSTTTSSTLIDLGITERPDWLGTRTLPLRPDGYAVALPTPPELRDRRFATIDLLPPPTGTAFEATVDEIPPDVLARSTWNSGCPIDVGGLRYLTLTFWGFDGRHHRGEMIVNASIADAVVEVFRKIDAARFPIEEMRVTRADELDAAPTGDGNNTGSFVCRVTTGSTGWSNHAYGKAIDINPFLNPYAKGELVVPELASDYLDRTNLRPGMIVAGDVVTSAFADAGWGWGGNFTSLTDTMHFSVNGH